MSLEQNFDKIIKQKISEAEFPFDESNWQKAGKMIDAERGAAIGAKSGKMFLLIGTLFLGVAAGTFFFLTMKSDKVDMTVISQNTNSINKITEVASQGNTEVNNVGQTGSTERSEQTTNTSISSNENNSSVKMNKTSITLKKEENTTHENPATENTSVSNDAAVSAAAKNAAVPTENNLNEAAKPSTNANASKASNAPSNSKGNKTQNPAHKPASKKPTLGKEAQDFYANNSKKPTNETQTPDEVLNASAQSNANLTSEYLDMHRSVLDMLTKDQVLKSSPHDFLRGFDEDYYKKSRRRIHYVNVEAGGAYMLGWTARNGTDAVGLNAFGGLNYEMKVKNILNFGIGAQFYNIGHINKSFYDRQNFEYDFGSNGHFTSITANSLYYIGIPVKVSRYITKSGKIGLGLNAGFLVGGKNTVTTYDESDLVKTNVKTTTGKGVYEGLNTTNVMMSVFYTQHLSRRFSLNGEFIYGLSDTYKKAASLNSAKENNMGVRLSLQFTIFPLK
jgi:hypothetical protein